MLVVVVKWSLVRVIMVRVPLVVLRIHVVLVLNIAMGEGMTIMQTFTATDGKSTVTVLVEVVGTASYAIT